MIDVTCSHCGQSFGVKPYRLARNRSGLLFCSAECRKAEGSTLPGRPTKAEPLVCPVCGERFHRKPAERLAVNFCSYRCAGTGSGNLRRAPKGARRSPRTEFAPGSTPSNHAEVGTVRVRKVRDGQRAFVKVAEPNVWRARAVVAWEAEHGPLPRGLVVHHRDRNPLNDEPGNLEALTRREHLAEHLHDFRD